MRQANLALSFLLELALIASLAYAGDQVAGNSDVLAVVLGVLLPVIAIVIWSRFAAPRAPRRLAGLRLLALKFVLFAVAAVLLMVVGGGLGRRAAGSERDQSRRRAPFRRRDRVGLTVGASRLRKLADSQARGLDVWHSVIQFGKRGRGAADEIRTHTVGYLKPVPPASWATAARNVSL